MKIFLEKIRDTEMCEMKGKRSQGRWKYVLHLVSKTPCVHAQDEIN